MNVSVNVIAVLLVADDVVFVGDLLNKGPDSFGVWRYVQERSNFHGANVLFCWGNHEDKHIRIAKGELQANFSQIICKEQLKEHYDECIAYFSSLPLYLQSHDFWLVHAGVVPEIPLEEQPRKSLLRGKMPWMKDAYDKSRGGWWEYYSGSTPVIYGHYAHSKGPRIQNNTYGIDTGCCHGDYLTAIILPERRLVQIKAEKDHWRVIRKTYSYLGTQNHL